MSTSKPHSDSPTCDDKLNWDKPLAHIKTRIEDCETPHVLGIHGDWGSGKTSFMRQVQWHLGGSAPQDGSVARVNQHAPDRAKELRKKIATVWFDAWRYQNEPAPVVALLQEMRIQMANWPAAKAKLAKLSTIAAYAIFDALSEAGKMISQEGAGLFGGVEKRGEQREKDHHDYGLLTNSIREYLQETIHALLPNKDDARVVVFIDDLDRCNPKAAMRLLEGLKIYLSIPQCVFVLGMNERILIDALRDEVSAPKEASPDELKLRAAHYLEKICTDIYRLPLPNSPAQLLQKWITNPAHSNAVFAAIKDINCLPPNPRRLKALANQIPLFAACAPLPNDLNAQNDWAVRIVIAAYIHQFNRELWERWHFNVNFWNEIKEWCITVAGANLPTWAQALKLPHKTTFNNATSNSVSAVANYHNPGDIEIFWIGSLIFANPNLTAQDFAPLLAKHQAS